MASGKITFATILALLVVLAAVYYRNSNDVLQQRLVVVLNALENLERKYHVSRRPKIAIGYGICTDVFIDAENLLDYNKNVGEPKHFDEISNEDELLKSFAYYFQYGAAAERFMSNNSLFDNLVAKARSFSSSYSTIGGNAAVMAMRLLKEGCDVVLAAKMTRALKVMIPADVTVVGKEVDRDDIHLIIEYKKGEVWGKYTSPRANRFIIHNDKHNPRVGGFEELDELLPRYRPDLLIVSGLQMMDNYPFTVNERTEKIKNIRRQMSNQPSTTKIHFEMASFAEEDFLLQIDEMLLPFADSLGMNEQEIVNLYHSLQFGNISLVTDSYPRVATVLDHMRGLFKLMREKSRTVANSRKLTRIHLHTLAYQAIMTVKDSAWKNTPVAAAKASLTAHRHVCASSDIDVDKATLVMDDSFSTSINSGTRIPLNIEKPVSCWEEVINVGKERISVDVCVAPVLVCTKISQTAGGGDNISSAGLVLQI